MNLYIHRLTFVLGLAALLPLAMRVSAAELAPPPTAEEALGRKYNVLFIAIDDLNDWVGCFCGNPQAITPHLDRFAKQQAMVMAKAYCLSTVCGPSRSSLLTGKRPSSTGVYGNDQNLKNVVKAKDVVTLSEYFGRNGYHTVSAGKMFHSHETASGNDDGKWAFHEVANPGGTNQGILWEELPSLAMGGETGRNELAWGACKAPVEETKDYLACKWAADQLQRDFGGKPFFLALGISKPHLPWIVPQQFYDLYPLEKMSAIEIVRDDLDEVVRKNGKPIFKPNPDFLLADKANLHKQAQRAYLANVSYVDHCLGVLFDTLGKSKYADNTIIMLWGDHGWYLSEKMKYGKTELWEESARVPFIVRVPDMTLSGFKCDGVVNLLDMYPTLVELRGLPPNAGNDGCSFVPLLKDPKMEWNFPTLTTYKFKNHSLTDGRYRYTWYGGRADGAEELYDHSTDPMEHIGTSPRSPIPWKSSPILKNIFQRTMSRILHAICQSQTTKKQNAMAASSSPADRHDFYIQFPFSNLMKPDICAALLAGFCGGTFAADTNGKPCLIPGRPSNPRKAALTTRAMSGNDYAANFGDFLDAAPNDFSWCFRYGAQEPHRDYEFWSGVNKCGKQLHYVDRVDLDTDYDRSEVFDHDKPSEGDPLFEKFMRCDTVIASWIKPTDFEK